MSALLINATTSPLDGAFTPENDTVRVNPHTAVTTAGCVLMTLTVILILAFNPLSLIIIHQVKSIQQTTKMFMTSLTVADLGIGLFWALPKLTENIAGTWVLGDGMCRLHGVGYRTFVALSVFSLLMLNIDRYIAIVYSLRYFRVVTVRRTKVVITVTWVTSVTGAVSTYGFVVYRAVSDTPPYLCVWMRDGIHQLAVVSFLFTSLMIMLALYSHILIIARRQARRIASVSIPPGFGRENGLLARPHLRIKSATTVFIITGAISLSWIPQIAIGAANFELSREMRILTDTLLMTNSWLNVVIYSFRNRDLRQRLFSLASRCRHLCPV